ncbi:MAG: mannose-1-phosphate guanylyltransferase [Verrucomicrobia bacterium]|jgi:mannose-1-phosphate guanylyltransferase|nr:mannose-1-phosphate guanylyltransferase [Verrucomicrobiota bacterium]
MQDNRYAVIMAGGKGERFWPLSTSKRPKQVLSIVGDRPMLAQAVERLAGFIPPERVLVITNASLVEVSREAVPELPPENIIGEPVGRDTAAACALGAAIVKARCENGSFCILTADHVIKDLDVFRQTLEEGFALAEQDASLVTIGITPTFASTGFGYIECGDTIDSGGEIAFRAAKRFVEKPDATTAQGYVDSGDFFWNSGMFIWSADALLKALGAFQPPLLAMAEAMQSVVDTASFDERLAEEYGKLGKISIDYAVMEKADNIVTASGAFGWFDVGSWPALEDHFDKDEAANVAIGDCKALDATGNIVVSNGRLTALIGVSDLVVVQADGVTMICPKDRAQEVKAMVQLLDSDGGYDGVL